MRNLSLTLIAILIFISACNVNNSANEETKFIEGFYKSYITELSKEDTKSSREDTVLNKYCTTRLITFLEKQYEEGELDWNPFLNAQDFDLGTINTIKINKEKSKYNLYSVSYVWPGTGETVDKIKLILVSEGNSYKIDYVDVGSKDDEKYKDIEI
jgi:hypothetical protein